MPGARAGYRMGNNEVIDSLIHDGLWCAFDAVHMGSGTEKYVGEFGGITREMQDEAAAKILADWGCDYLQGAVAGLASVERPWGQVVKADRRKSTR